MHKTTVWVFMSLYCAFAAAQAPANKNKKAVSKTAVKSQMSASEQATAAAQAAAIAQAYGQPPAATALGTSAEPTQVSEPAMAPAAVPSSGPSTVPAAVLTTAPRGAPHDAVSAEELDIAKRVHQGQLPCEMGASIRVEHDAAQPGYFHLQGKGFRYRMRPVVTSTGAIRLEDAKAGAVWLQLANKSMLMDQKKGRRLADECAHPEQVAYAESMKTQPPPKLFDTTGMGR